ncbi:hypothetical protein [Embleya sp. NPDC001921]
MPMLREEDPPPARLRYIGTCHGNDADDAWGGPDWHYPRRFYAEPHARLDRPWRCPDCHRELFFTWRLAAPDPPPPPPPDIGPTEPPARRRGWRTLPLFRRRVERRR